MRAEGFLPVDRLSIIMRLSALAAGWIPVGIIYTFSAQLTAPATTLPEIFLDRWIPFGTDLPSVLVYLSYFALIPYAYLRVDAQRLWQLMCAMLLCAAISGLVFLLYPTQIPPPLVNADVAVHPLLTWLQGFDTPRNCFPSLHVSLSLVCAFALHDRTRPLHSTALWLWAGIILWSVVRTRRHLGLDMLGGSVVAMFAWWLAGWAGLRSLPGRSP